jgi:very-short-patch-repair endonuclease
MATILNWQMNAEKRKILRKEPTRAEYLLWQRISNKQLYGYRFRRQFGIGPYIVDFYCPEAKLVIEVDGGYHTEAEQIVNDEQRQKDIEALGLRMLRFTNGAILESLNEIIELIKEGLPLTKGELRG